MARHKSAEKAYRQSVKHAASNRDARSKVRTAVKELETKIKTLSPGSQDARSQIAPMFNKVQQLLMKTGGKRAIHPQAAARKISRLSLAIDRAVGKK